MIFNKLFRKMKKYIGKKGSVKGVQWRLGLDRICKAIDYALKPQKASTKTNKNTRHKSVKFITSHPLLTWKRQ